MSMSRKHYVQVAEMVSERLETSLQLFESGTSPEAQAYRLAVSDIAKGLAYMFKQDNPNFRYDRFYAACGLDEWGDLIF